ncbi:3-deoxy-manno-octulosonate cytidylyltransferase, mitochondrial [Selaginella moellendorffii]|nr:3-deoxy-manno-octulosonate cytidylyltransferase, mitochondrial [Selaginella moellendorffii]XP_024543282.1 3-deoxy-manno-octulosonate cytidylyltransferase, mitochondrial [Selaginella moellendorffii]|eukprot:XP_002982588.2 3-deoxy-manno-octulosonate cytidylyltransferase, mitochondrial [Selaginella moellendorffii]
MEGSGDSGRSWMVRGVLVLGGVAAAAMAWRRGMWWRSRSRVVGIIPARYASSRFQGKPLALILGKPMIQRTWEQARLAKTLDALVVATDDERIRQCCEEFGAEVVMTSEKCPNGTERCNEAVKRLKRKFDIVVNIQGDEPLIDPDIIDGVVMALKASPDAMCSTAVTSLKPQDASDTNRVKCIVDKQGYAIYFSRGLLPFNKKGVANDKFPYLLHLGIQCYDAHFLSMYPLIAPTALQLEEDLEQLKVIENGYKIKVINVDHDAHGVDSPGDIASIESLMRGRNIA